MHTARQSKDHRTLVAGFNLYRTPGVCEALDELHVSTCYSGVVVDSPARVVSAAGDEVVLAVSPEQAAALAHSHLAIVESPVHGTSFRASVQRMQPSTGEVSLSEFEAFKDYIGRRKLSRVIPVHPMLVRLAHGDDKTFGRVIDISSGALAAVIDSRFLTAFEDEKDFVDLDVWGETDTNSNLPDFSVAGQVVRAHPTEDLNAPYWKVVISFDIYPALEAELSRYIARRQREVLVALEQETQ